MTKKKSEPFNNPFSGLKLPPKATAPEDAGRQIVDAVAAGTFRVLIGSDARMLDRLSRVAPTRAITTVADQMRKLLGV